MVKNVNLKKNAKIAGEALMHAGLQAAWASVEMSSKFSILSFAKDQDTLQRAADALRGYLIIGSIWTLGSSAVLWSEYNSKGIIAGLLANIGVMGWITWSYLKAFDEASRRYNLQKPSLFGSPEYVGNNGIVTSWLPYPTERVFHPGELQDNIFISSNGESAPFYNGVQKRNPTGPGYPVLNTRNIY